MRKNCRSLLLASLALTCGPLRRLHDFRQQIPFI